MERVSFKMVSFRVAEALKEVGYPVTYRDFDPDGMFSKIKPTTTYIEIWLWLWKEKHIYINCMPKGNTFQYCITHYKNGELEEIKALEEINTIDGTSYSEQEEAIVAGIEYLVDNNLIK